MPLTRNAPPVKRALSIEERIRTFLVIWTSVLTLLIIIAYLITKDIRVLFGGTVVAIAVSFVYAYYFRRWR
jgi:hypothetical protein